MSIHQPEPGVVEPLCVKTAACCPWRTALQTPMLLFVAGGLAFASQQAWRHRAEFQLLLAGGAPGCAASAGCTAPADACGSMMADTGCGSRHESAVAEASDDGETLSALAPDNSAL
jgi:hypothetical protein